MQRRQHVRPAPVGRRRLCGAAILRHVAVFVMLAVIATACGGDSPSSDATGGTPSPDQSASSATTGESPSPLVVTDVSYNEHPKRQVLDVYVPDGDGPFPTLVAFHGGGFHAGSKRDYTRHAKHFVDRGIAFVSATYRLAPSAIHPAQVEDAHCALAWVHENADRYRFDQSQVVVMGGSAGAYLVGMLATADDHDRYLTDCPHDLPADPIAGAIPLYGPYDMQDLDDEDYPPQLMASASLLAGKPYDELTPDVRASMSPIAQIDGSEPPVLAIHGTLDRSVPSLMSERFATALEAAGVDVELLLVEGPHGFDVVQPFENPPTGDVLAAIEQFVADVG